MNMERVDVTKAAIMRAVMAKAVVMGTIMVMAWIVIIGRLQSVS